MNYSCKINTNNEFESSCRGSIKIESEHLRGAYLLCHAYHQLIRQNILKLMPLQLVKKFSNVYGNARFTTAVTRAKPVVCNVSQMNPFATFTLHFLRCNQACQVGVEFRRFGNLFSSQGNAVLRRGRVC